MYHIINHVRENLGSKFTNNISWSDSDFLFREYTKAVMRRYPYDKYIIEHCYTEKELNTLLKKYALSDNTISDNRIVMVHDRNYTSYAVTTCRQQRVGLGGRNLFESTEDTLRCKYIHKMFWLIMVLKRFLTLEEEPNVIDRLFKIVAHRYLDTHTIDMYSYFIENEEYPNFYKL